MNRYESSMLAVLGAAAVLVGAALYYEHVGGQAPCPLCLTQRLWFLLAGLVAFIALTDNPARRIYPVLVGLSAVAGAGFSIRQIYLQLLPADRMPACGPSSIDFMIDRFPASEVLRAMVTGTGDCATVSWTFLGISMAGWALLGFIALCALAALPWLRR